MKFFDKPLLYLYRRMRSLDDWDRYQQYRRKYELHPSVRFNGPGIIFSGDGRIQIGEGTYLGSHSCLQAKEGATISIGSHTSISHYFVAYTSNVVADQNLSMPSDQWQVNKASVSIGSYCWIGFRVFAVEGVTIGDHVVVGAHSVVTHDLEPNGIYAGVPARLIGRKQAAP